MIAKSMDPARPDDVDPADPFNVERADHPILETIEIATAGEDNEECSRELVEPLMRVAGVCAVKIDPENARVIVTFDARRTHTPDLHDAILKSGYRPPRWRIDVVGSSSGTSPE